MCVCVSLASDSSETIEVIIIKLGMITASDMVLHHVFIILTVSFIQGHTYLNHEYNKCSMISKTIQATIPITFTVKIIRLKVYTNFSQRDDLALHSRLFKLFHDGILMHEIAYNLCHACVDGVDLYAR